MEARDEEMTGKSQGSHQPVDSTVMDLADGASTEQESRPPVACRNRVCRMFGQLVVPEPPRGVCPACKTALPGSTLGRKTPPIDRWKVKQLAERYKADYTATTQALATACEQLATVTERLEKVKAGSVEHQRLFQMWQQLTDKLEASRASRTEPGYATSGDPRVIFYIPTNNRPAEWQGDTDEMHVDRTPGVASPSREAPSPTVEPAASAVGDEEPELYVHGRRVTVRDVEAMLRDWNDEEKARWRSGQMDKSEAYARAQHWLRQRHELGSRR